MKLVKRTKIPKPDNVHNLHIEKNHNYVANGLVVSNCHGAKGPILSKILTDHAGTIPHRFGVTGTLPKDPCDLMAVHNALGPVRCTITAHELMEKKVLSTINIDILQLSEDLKTEYATYVEETTTLPKLTYKQFKSGYFPDYESEKSYIHRKESRINWIAGKLVEKVALTGNVLCLVDSIPLGRKIAEYIPGAILVNGQDVKDPTKRKAIYDLFKTRDDLIVIATVHIVGTGLSINRIFNLVSVDIGKSFIRVIQGIGRGLRRFEDKTHVTYTDICSDLKYGQKHLVSRISFYDDAHYPYKKQVVEYTCQEELT